MPATGTLQGGTPPTQGPQASTAHWGTLRGVPYPTCPGQHKGGGVPSHKGVPHLPITTQRGTPSCQPQVPVKPVQLMGGTPRCQPQAPSKGVPPPHTRPSSQYSSLGYPQRGIVPYPTCPGQLTQGGTPPAHHHPEGYPSCKPQVPSSEVPTCSATGTPSITVCSDSLLSPINHCLL